MSEEEKNSTPCLFLSQHQSKHSSAPIHTTTSFFQGAYTSIWSLGCAPLELEVTCHHVSAHRKQQLTYLWNNKNRQSSVNKPLTVSSFLPAYFREAERVIESQRMPGEHSRDLFFTSCVWLLWLSLLKHCTAGLFSPCQSLHIWKASENSYSDIHPLISWHSQRFLWKAHLHVPTNNNAMLKLTL